MRDVLSYALSLKDEIISIREDLHRIPELGNREIRTSSYITNYLEKLGLQTEHYLETAVVGSLSSGSGPTIALRADMDALPLEETTGCAYSSCHPGAMHACGHDVHMTSLLGAAHLLSQHRDLFSGTIRFLFQPDEEGGGGARRLLEEGALKDVSAVYGGHVDPNLPLGTFGVKYGKFYAASDVFRVVVKGVGTHGATPEKGRSALLGAVEMIHALSRLQSSSSDRFVLSVGTLHSGTAGNIIPAEAEFSGILRTLGEANRREMKNLLRSTLDKVAEVCGVEVSLSLRESYGGIVNTDRETALLEASLRKTFGDDKVLVLEEPTMTTEDFGYYTEACSGSFFHMGAGCSLPLHNPSFLPDPMVPVYGTALYSGLVLDALGKGKEQA